MIAANGDSFTQEFYLDIKDRWTTRIGVVHNLAHGGGSHERVLKTSIDFLNKNYPTVYIIGWPIYNRSMLPLSNGSICMINSSLPIDENTTEKYESINKFYYTQCYNEYYHFKNRLEYMIFIQNFCEAKKIKLLYFLSMQENINDKFLMDISEKAYMKKDTKEMTKNGIKYNFNILKELIQKINDNTSWIGNTWYSMQEHTREFPREKDGHPAEEGSLHWANYVKNYI
jgi:hypothetical protein